MLSLLAAAAIMPINVRLPKKKPVLLATRKEISLMLVMKHHKTATMHLYFLQLHLIQLSTQC